MKDLSHVIRKFNRFELKYILGLKQAWEFRSALQDYLVPDEHGGSSGRYPVASLYFDSPDLRCYQEKESGIKYRRKLRIRHYPSPEAFNDQTPVFLEIKQRVDRATQKRRVVMPYSAALRLCNDREIPEHNPEDQAVIHEIYVFLWQYNLVPASIVRYDRQALIGTRYDIGVRVTFDREVCFQAHPLHLHEQQSSLPILGADRVVMEIKVNERIPTWLTGMIADHNLQLQRISKYCRSIDAAQGLGRGTHLPLQAESSREVLASAISVYSLLEQEYQPRN